MAKSTSSRPVLALEDLEDMDSGMSVEEMLGSSDEPITSPFAPKLEEPKAEEPEAVAEDDGFSLADDLEETPPADMDVDPEPELDLGEELDPTPEPEPEPVAEKPKRTRKKAEPKAETKPEVIVPDVPIVPDPLADDALSIESADDLDMIDEIPEPAPKKVADDKSSPRTGTEKPYDPIEAMISPVGDVPKWMTIVAYGKNGTGKTTFGASGDKTLVIEVEKDGTFSVRDRGSKAKKYKVKTWDDFEQIYWYLKKNPGKYEIVCIDTLTRLAELCLRSVVLSKKAEGAELLDKDIVKVTLPQRGDISQRMIFWLNAFAELPCHKVWLCQEASGGDDKDVANVEVYPDLQRKVRVYVCSDATIIARTEIRMKSEVVGGVPKEVPQYIMRVAPSESYLSKDRTKALGAGLLNPKIDKLIEKVYA